MDHCAVCHGRGGKGDTGVGKNMYLRVPNLTGPDPQSRSDGALFYIIQNGVRWTGMPAWKGEHSPGGARPNEDAAAASGDKPATHQDGRARAPASRGSQPPTFEILLAKAIVQVATEFD